MKNQTVGNESDPDLLFLLGWGNRLQSENVSWLVDLFVADGYRVHVIELPDHITDFHREYLEPVQSYADELDSYRLLCHSTGGLIGSYLDGAETTTYLSPWWGIHPSQGGALFTLAKKLPVSRPILPNDTVTPAVIGKHATESQLESVPDHVSPKFLATIIDAQEHRPAIDESAVVFCSLRDEIVSINAIGKAASSSQLVIYDGGHELFSSHCREEYAEQLREAVKGGLKALRTRSE